MNKIKLCSIFIIGVFGFSLNYVWAANYKIDPEHSSIVFKISHIGISTLVGQVPGITGEITYDEKKIEQSAVKAAIDTRSTNSHHAERDKHLHGKDFLDVRTYPTATFVSTQYEGNAESGTLKGDFTLMGKTKPIAIKLKKIGEGKDPWGGYRIGFKGETSLNRKDFGLNYEMGPHTDTVQIEIFIEAIKL